MCWAGGGESAMAPLHDGIIDAAFRVGGVEVM